jgi:hypothetical protein
MAPEGGRHGVQPGSYSRVRPGDAGMVETSAPTCPVSHTTTAGWAA